MYKILESTLTLQDEVRLDIIKTVIKTVKTII